MQSFSPFERRLLGVLALLLAAVSVVCGHRSLTRGPVPWPWLRYC